MSKIYGYVRVSTSRQHEDRQLIALREYGVAERNIVVEKRSGKDFNRPHYKRLLGRLRPGDTLVIKSLDRLGRDYGEIQEQWRVISKERGAAIVVLDMPLLNTRKNAELVGQLITDLVLQLLSFVAQTEREDIRRRQREGIEAAKARGVRFGRPRLDMPEDFERIVEEWRKGEFTAAEAAERLGISRTTFFRRVRALGRLRGRGHPAAAPKRRPRPKRPLAQNTPRAQTAVPPPSAESEPRSGEPKHDPPPIVKPKKA